MDPVHTAEVLSNVPKDKKAGKKVIEAWVYSVLAVNSVLMNYNILIKMSLNGNTKQGYEWLIDKVLW